jgi:hypothetical protein
MKWLELILFRSSGPVEHLIDFRDSKRIVQEMKEPGLQKVSICSHATIPFDFCIALHWQTAQPQLSGSDLGLSLMQELKRSGLVDHSVWVERNGDF